MLPDRDRFLSALAHHQRRLRLTSAVWAFVAGAIATARFDHQRMRASALPPGEQRQHPGQMARRDTQQVRLRRVG